MARFRGSRSGRRSRGGSGRPFRPTEWWGSYLVDQVALAPGVISSAQVSDADLAAFQKETEPTVVRTHGSLIIVNESSLGYASIAHGAFGLIVMDDPTGDEPAVISPIDDADADWFLHGYWQLQANSIATDGSNTLSAGPMAAERFQLDSQAMRKLPPRKSVMFVIENDGTSNFTVQWHVAFRTLLKE